MKKKEKRKSYLPRVIRVSQVKGKRQFGVISLCLQISLGKCSRLVGVLLLKWVRVSRDFADLIGDGKSATMTRGCPL